MRTFAHDHRAELTKLVDRYLKNPSRIIANVDRLYREVMTFWEGAHSVSYTDDQVFTLKSYLMYKFSIKLSNIKTKSIRTDIIESLTKYIRQYHITGRPGQV